VDSVELVERRILLLRQQTRAISVWEAR